MQGIKKVIKYVCDEACDAWNTFKLNNFRMRANEQKSKFKQDPVTTIKDLRNHGLDRQQIMLQLNITEDQLQKYWPQEQSKYDKALHRSGQLFKYEDPTLDSRKQELMEVCQRYNIDVLSYKQKVLKMNTYELAKQFNIPDEIAYKMNRLLRIDQKDCEGKNGTSKTVDVQEFLDLYWEGWTSKQLASKYGMCVRNINKMIQTYREQGTISESNKERQARLKAIKIKKSK